MSTKYSYGIIDNDPEVSVTVPEYDHDAIENKWIERWAAEQLFYAVKDPDSPKKYVLVMFPYPSGPAHMGHVANYCLGDVFARYYMRIGYGVLHPMGYDAFGLPAENAAIQSGVQPAEWTRNNIKLIRADLQRLGYAYDWFGTPVLYVTVDGGQTWTTGTLPPNARPNAGMLLVWRSGATLHALVYWWADGTSMSAIVASDDGGRTWTLAGTPFSYVLMNNGYGLALGPPMAAMDDHQLLTSTWSYDDKATLLFKSRDSGLTWKQVAYTGLTGDIKDFDFLNASDGWAATNTMDTVAALWATTDGGATWTRILSTP